MNRQQLGDALWKKITQYDKGLANRAKRCSRIVGMFLEYASRSQEHIRRMEQIAVDEDCKDLGEALREASETLDAFKASQQKRG